MRPPVQKENTMSHIPIEIVALEPIRFGETADGIVIICPRCGNRSDDPEETHARTAARFQLLEDIVCFRQVYGVRRDPDGTRHLRIDGLYETGEGYDDGASARIECGNCFGEFAIPDSLNLWFE